jgi:alpha-D-ribose 1-methylphosphonate 5-triphosphate diphosphatase
MNTVPTTPDFSIVNTTAVLPDRLIDDAIVVVRNGTIEEITEAAAHRATPDDAIDARGAFTVPGAIDLHSDGLEKELRPRPGVELPMDFAIRSFEGRVRGAGVTTVFHGVAFENGAKYERSVAQAHAMCDAIENLAASDPTVDHRILYRLDVRDSDGLDGLAEQLAHQPSGDQDLHDRSPLVSYEDHTPGRGQYSDRRWYERYIAGTKGLTARESESYIDDIAADREARSDQRDCAVLWLAKRARTSSVRLMCHDPADSDEIDEAVASSVAISEFPTTVIAARASREHSLPIVCGAPNAVRGQSHSGNVSARELIALGLCDALASDYMPSTLFGAVGVLVDGGVCDLPTAVGLVTSGPAATAGLGDRGRLEPGRRGDVTIVKYSGAIPSIRLVVSQCAAT